MMFKFFLIFAILRIAAACVRQLINEDILGGTNFCVSEECYHAARSYHDSINYFINPCDDFYDFVCFGWKNKHKIPSKKNRWTNFDAQYFRVLGQIHQSLEYLHRPERKIEWKVSNLYKGCMNEIRRENLHLQPLREILKKIGGWPLIGDEFDENNYDWLGTLAWMIRNIGISDAIFDVRVDADLRNSTNNILYFSIVKHVLIPDKLEPKDIHQTELLRTVGNFHEIIGSKELQEMKEVLEFQRNINRIVSAYAEGPMYERFVHSTISQLQEAFGNRINITSYMQTILGGIIQVTNKTEIMAPPTDVIQKFSEQIENTTNRAIANLIGWRVVERLRSLTISEFRQSWFQIVKTSVGSEMDIPLHEHCIQITQRLLSHALGSLYVKDHFNDEYVADLYVMLNKVKSSFHDIIQESEWMDAQTQQKALLKLDFMRQVVGYPEWIADNRKLDKFYETLGEVSENNFFQSALNIHQFIKRKELMKLTVPFDKYKDWISNPLEINAYYGLQINGLFLAAAITQWPFYKYGLPLHINLGSIGTIMGHEMTHGFDSNGYKFDETGSMSNWWNPEVERKFINEEQCFIQQYENYEPMKGYRVNGHSTLAENIADNGGVREAFRAWKKYEKQHGTYYDKRLPILEFSKDQMFFIAYAYVWCSNEKGLALMGQVLTDEHSPNKARIIGSLSNNRDFHKAFNCTKGNRMYRENVCRIW